MSEFNDTELPRFGELEAEYEVLRELGRGGTAVVYLARERELDRLVALKVIRAAYVEDEEAAARLVREARTVGGLQHPNIVVLYGTRRLRDRSLALIMQYVPGRTLKEEVEAAGPLPFDRATRVLNDIGRALAYAHRQRIVHRDIKPENIYIDDESGVARLSDFGIARPWDADSGLTLPGSAIGTPSYMSPEQIEGGALDGRSDLYSLGMIGYEMVTGSRPWAGENLFSIIYKQKHEQLPPLASVRPDVPDTLRLAIEGALSKDRDQRWANADQFMAVLAGLPVDRARAERPAAAEPVNRVAAASGSGPSAPPAGGAGGKPPAADPTDPVAAGLTIQYRREPGDPRESGSHSAAAADAWRQRRHRKRQTHARAGGTASEAAGVAGKAAADTAGAAGKAAAGPPGARTLHGSGAGSGLAGPDGVAPATSSAPNGEPGAKSAEQIIARGRGRRRLLAAGLVLVLVGSAVSAAVRPWAGEDASDAAPSGELVDLAAPPSAAPATPAVASGGSVAYALLGGQQQGLVGDTLPQPLVVRVENSLGEAVADAPVRFRVVEGDSEVIPAEAATDWAGSATAVWVVRSAGAHRVEAVVEAAGGAVATFTATAVPAGPRRLATLSPTQITAGASQTAPLAVRVEDARGNPMAGVPVRFTVQSGGGSVEPASAVSGEDGTVSASWTLGSSGEQAASARINNVAGTTVVFRGASTGPAPLAVRGGLSAGGTHTCSLDGGGALSCWGGNDRGQIGDGTTSRRDGPARVSLPDPVAAVASGVSHTCTVTTTGDAFCWGSNSAGQLGDGTQLTRTRPVKVATDVRLTAVGTGTSHSCALAASGALFCWGQNTHGQLGDGGTTDRAAPVRAGGSRAFRSVAVGWSHTCALGTDGGAYCWGRNAGGQLGDGSTTDRREPVRVAGAHRFTLLTAGSAHTCGIRTDGALLCWGQNSHGQLGTGAEGASIVPAPVRSEARFTAAAAGGVHTCALTADGDAVCWGRNTYGQLGDGTTDDRALPTAVAGGMRFTAIVANGAHTCGSMAGSGWYCWGYNIEGQLGDGTRSNQLRPTAVGRR